MFDSIIFDLDGTLWDAVDNILISWNDVLKKHREVNKLITKQELTDCMGRKMDDIAQALFPDADKNMQTALMEECSAFELEYLAKNGANLFDELTKVIKELSAKYRLFICSNCQKGYIECFLKYYELEKYFTDTECWGNTGLSKGENNVRLIKRNNLSSPVYVGDTQGDLNSAIFADIPFIFASYGFGNANKPDYVLNALSELPELLESIKYNLP